MVQRVAPDHRVGVPEGLAGPDGKPGAVVRGPETRHPHDPVDVLDEHPRVGDAVRIAVPGHPGQQVQGAVQAEQVDALRTSDDWQRWLDVASRLPSYSFNNVLLVLAQRPDATTVAGHQAWKALGRQVMKGEKGTTDISYQKAVLTARDTIAKLGE